MSQTSIEWTDETANIFYAVDKNTGRRGWHCEVVSEGCQNCYAATKNMGFWNMGTKRPYRQDQRPKLTWKIDRKQMEGWKRRRIPRRIFVNSMTDTFGEWWSKDWIYDALDAMAAAPLMTFQILTKRVELMVEIIQAWMIARGMERVPDNMHLMISAENQARANERSPIFRQLVGLATLGLSLEPLIGEIDLYEAGFIEKGLRPVPYVDWVIAGGESSQTGTDKKIRPCHPKWIRVLRDQCQYAKIPYFFKQWGDWAPTQPTNDRHRCVIMTPNGSTYSELAADKAGIFDNPTTVSMVQVGKDEAGNTIDGRKWQQFPSPRLEVEE